MNARTAMTSNAAGMIADVLTILGASSVGDVRIRMSQTWTGTPGYDFEALLASAPHHALPIDEGTACALLADGALPSLSP